METIQAQPAQCHTDRKHNYPVEVIGPFANEERQDSSISFLHCSTDSVRPLINGFSQLPL